MVLIFSFSLLLLFGCSDYERDNIYDQNGKYYTGGVIDGSSSSGSSSSSAGDSGGGSSSSFGSSSSSVVVSSSSSSIGSSGSLSSSSLFVSVPCGNASTDVGTVTCGGQAYKTVQIGTQVWMAENLNYDVPDDTTDVCFSNNSSNCTTYGRLYNWTTAMGLSSSCNYSICSGQVQTKHQGICPSGWHIPSNEDWDKLYRYADGTTGTSSLYASPTAGKHLKAKTGWYSCGPSGSGSSYLCEDTHGFSALPGGGRFGSPLSDGAFFLFGFVGIWWSANEYDSYLAYNRYMSNNNENAGWNDHYEKFDLVSVRCVQD